MDRKACHSQAVFADALEVSPSAVAKMHGRLRREGPTSDDGKLLEQVFNVLVEDKKENIVNRNDEGEETTDPKVIILKRQRR